ncbi:MAG: hypothetical protein CVV64_00350 [Candidatus Wallbacteria bacterium HGW-Wallbacteria-1]|uniref:Uncharacterized protein n=1 Tax=Candidatus Wallbacteria bacterium HGW-Wallbacteria-1 TaxID=2013854 RepID=A0A2N1PU94_9BACT|nr:MAG: hypothetical protein CVV64_00350 [Candidatus Wallbacteria bacterium HGW-Wallbacteria-1]
MITNFSPLNREAGTPEFNISEISRNQRGMSFYIVSALVGICLVLGLSYIYSLTSENRMLTKTLISEICLNLCESSANEAYYYARKQMNRQDLVFYKMFREPMASGTAGSGGAVLIPTPETENMAKEYGAKIKTWVMFANRSLFTKNLFAKDIDPTLVDRVESMGTLRVVSYAEYKGTKKLLTIDRDVKVVNTIPPKYDFTLWVRLADRFSFNTWPSKSGAQIRNLALFNGTDDPSKPLESNTNGYVFLGNGRPLPLDPATKEYYDVPPIPDPSGTNPSNQNTIAINLTAFEVLGQKIIKKFFKKFQGLWGNLDLVKKGWPQKDLISNLKQGSLFTDSTVYDHKVYGECQGHDWTMEAESPVNLGFGSIRKNAAGLKYFIGTNYNQYIRDTKGLGTLKFLDITNSGFDINGSDFWRDGENASPQFARQLLGNVYKSYVKLKLLNLYSINDVDPATGQGMMKLAYCPWTLPPPTPDTPFSGKFKILADPADSSKPAQDPAMFLENPSKPLDHDDDPPVSDDIKNNYHRFFKTEVVKKIYDIRAEDTGKPFTTYFNSEYGYSENVENWSKAGYIPHELSWDKISKTFGSFDEFVAKSGLKESMSQSPSMPLLRLDGVWMITDFEDFKFPSHLIVYGKGTLIFVNTNVKIDGIYNLETFKQSGKEILQGNKFTPVADPETKCTIVLMTFRQPGMPVSKKIHVTNKLVMASLVAPDSMLVMDQAVQSDSADSQGEKKWDVDLYGSLVVDQLDITQFMDQSKAGDDEAPGGGHIRFDQTFRPDMEGGKLSAGNYHVTASKKVSFWNFADVSSDDLSSTLSGGGGEL